MNISDAEKKIIYYNMTLFNVCLKLYGINYRHIIKQLSKNNENIPNTISKTVIEFYTFISKNNHANIDDFHNYIYYDFNNYIPSYNDLKNQELEVIYLYNSIIEG